MVAVFYLIPNFLYLLQVLRTALSNRLAKVQGFLFRAAFLRRVPIFFRLIFENLVLCFLQSTLHSTSKYVTGTLSLRFRQILTKHIHAQYFQVVMAVIVINKNPSFNIYESSWLTLISFSKLNLEQTFSYFPL